MEKMAKELLTIASAPAQEDDSVSFRAAVNRFFSEHAAADFGKIAHRKSGDAILHVLARNGKTANIRFLLEEFAGKSSVDIEIRYRIDGLNSHFPTYEYLNFSSFSNSSLLCYKERIGKTVPIPFLFS